MVLTEILPEAVPVVGAAVGTAAEIPTDQNGGEQGPQVVEDVDQSEVLVPLRVIGLTTIPSGKQRGQETRRRCRRPQRRSL